MSYTKIAYALIGLLGFVACAGAGDDSDQAQQAEDIQSVDQTLVGQKCSPGKLGPAPMCLSSAEYCEVGSACGLLGTCKSRPTTCTTLYSPVCGCDYKTYTNACVAARSGVSVRYPGVCKAIPL